LLLTIGVATLGLAPRIVLAQDEGAITADATIRFVHGVNGGPEVDVLLDGQILAEAVPYGAATDYIPIAPGDRVLQVVPTGQPGDAAITEQELGVEAAGAYIFVALGPLNEVESRVLDVNLDEMTPGMARARLTNAAWDAGALDLSVTGGDTLFSDVGFGDGSDYVDLSPGTYSVDLRGEEDRVLGTVADVAIEPARAYDLVAIGQLADESITLLTLVTTVDPTCAEALGITGTAEDACVRLTHAAPDSAGTDVYINDSLVAQNLEYGSATEFVAVPAGEGRVFKVTATSAPIEEAIIEADLTLDAGQAYEVLVTGNPDDLQLTVTGVDLRPVPEGQARLGVIHVSPDTGSIDLSFAEGPTLFEGIEYRGVSEYIAVDEGTYALQVHPAEDQMVILESELEVEAGTVYDVVAVGRTDTQTVELLVLTAPVPLQEGLVATPAGNMADTPSTAAGTVEAVATMGETDDEEAAAETVVAAESTPAP
jgi:hypothetical protein